MSARRYPQGREQEPWTREKWWKHKYIRFAEFEPAETERGYCDVRSMRRRRMPAGLQNGLLKLLR